MMRGGPLFRTIRAKLMVRYIPMMAVSILALFLALEFRLYSQEHKRLIEDLHELMKVEQSIVQDAVWEYDATRIDTLLHELKDIPYFHFAIIKDVTGTLIARVGEKLTKAIPPELILTEDLVHHHADGQMEKIGTLTIAAHTGPLRKMAIDRIMNDLLIFLVVIVALVAITIVATRQVIDLPVSLLKESIDRARKSGQIELVNWASRDELGDVVFAFNELQIEKARSRGELEEYQENLEKIVDERTAELTFSQQEAERQRQLLQVVLDSMTDGVAAFDKQLNLIVCNNRFLEIRDFPDYFARAGTPFEHFIDYDLARNEFGDENPDKIAEFQIQRAKQFKAHEIERQRPNGTYIRVRGGPIPGGGFVSTFSDITKSKETEEMLQLAKDRAEAASEAKASFLAAMSHEIRTPMNGVIGMIDLLRHTRLTAEQAQMMETVRDSAFSLLTIINDILDFSKIEAGKLSLENAPVSVEDLVEGVAETLAVNARDKKDFFILSYVDPEIPRVVLGDQVRLRQILFNLAGNAVKFTEHGKVMIMANRLYQEELRRVNVRFDIIDTGIGISQGDIDKLFKPFEQAELSTTRRFGGTGLGLSISRHLASLMEGEITVKSEEGKGSTFTVIIPFDIPDKQPEQDRFFNCQGLRILTLVSDPDIRPLISGFLRHDGASVTATADEHEAVKKLQEALAEGKPYNVFLMGSAWLFDEKVALVKKVRAIKGLEKTRFVFMNRERTGLKHDLPADTVEIASYPFRQSTLLKGIAVVSGRASPDIMQVPMVATEGLSVPATLEEAEKLGQLVLVAEDNKINQDVIRRQLNMLGFVAEITDDGEQALARFDPGRHSMLLTDCHMPKMDGFDLTKAIRDKEMETGQHLPIVAITANALQGERERCLQKGMDDYLTKPIDIYKLKMVMERWLPDVMQAINPAFEEIKIHDENNEGGTQGDDLPVNINALKEAFDADEATCREILKDYAISLEEGLVEIHQSYKEENLTDLEATAHRLKSSSRAVGAYGLADLFEGIELSAASDKLDQLQEFYGNLDAAGQSVLIYIQNM